MMNLGAGQGHAPLCWWHGTEVVGMLNADAVLLGQEAAHLLALSRACEIRPGLTDLEFDRIEAEYGFEFADDHRAFLAAGLPVNSAQEPAGSAWKRPWPDWRDGDEEEIRAHLGWPVAGVLSALQDGAWLDSWGPRPGDAAEAQRIAERELANAPKLVPIYAHRFLP